MAPPPRVIVSRARNDAVTRPCWLTFEPIHPPQAGVTKSCTVRLNSETYCIRDDAEWIDCPNGPAVDDLVAAIDKLYHSS